MPWIDRGLGTLYRNPRGAANMERVLSRPLSCWPARRPTSTRRGGGLDAQPVDT
ncbi:hypothetical protein KAW53_09015 [Candidatus Bathyarchaeota archaeon]|nr:hypothetical protein [Candidatus Bathyarchaeota archaeon]